MDAALALMWTRTALITVGLIAANWRQGRPHVRSSVALCPHPTSGCSLVCVFMAGWRVCLYAPFHSTVDHRTFVFLSNDFLFFSRNSSLQFIQILHFKHLFYIVQSLYWSSLACLAPAVEVEYLSATLMAGRRRRMTLMDILLYCGDVPGPCNESGCARLRLWFTVYSNHTSCQGSCASGNGCKRDKAAEKASKGPLNVVI